MELIRRVDGAKLESALNDWAWAGPISELQPMFLTLFGDVFLQGSDGAFWFLDTLEGSIQRLWDDGAALQAALNSAAGQDRYLMSGLAQLAQSRELAPADGEVLGFKVPPVVGGSIDIENLEVTDLEVALSLAGQIHAQVHPLPPGTPLTGGTNL